MKQEEVVIVQGNEACVRGAIKAGCRFFAGYPITPASEIAEVMSVELPKHQGIFIQMEDEIASINTVIGAAWGGFKACTATSGPGFSLMQEGIGYAAITETPCVIFNVQRGGPATGQPTLSAQQDVMQAKYGSHGDYEIIALCPSSVQEAFDLTVKAFNFSERYRVPTIVLSDEIVGHTREKLRIPSTVRVLARRKPKAPPNGYKPYRALKSGLLDGMPSFGQGFKVLIDGQLHDERGIRAGHDPVISGKLVKRLCEKITDHASELVDLDAYFTHDAHTIVIAYGSVARSAFHAVKLGRGKGLKVGFLKLKILWPFPDEEIKKTIRKAKKILVPEMNIGKMCREVERVSRGNQEVISLPKVGGAMHTPQEILECIKG
ncbi:MAG: 2-oxoacid:acceptor oxidoreductase subunit alpha [Deltaproteobacteria bacterium]|nr:2-oxoacid:acceptor oxidoreductase subunit alpha [Deltaproteobacteria bacterium]